MNWETLRADEYCIAVKDGTHDTPKPVDFGYKLVTGKHVKNGQIDSSSAYYISEEDYNAINKRSMVERWDVIMSMIGTVGEAAVVKNDPDYAIKNVALFKCGGSEVRGKWLCYYLNSPEGKGKMLGEMKGSSQQFLSLKQLRELPIMFSEEKVPRIVEIISNYDDLIENNQKQIKLLEEAAQRLYKEWFVDLRFPGHENTKIVDGVPEEWNWCKLEDAIQLDPKVTLTKERMKQFIPMSALSTSSMVLDESQFTETTSNSGSKFQNGDTLLARITPCLENGKTAYVSGLKSDEGAVGSTEYIVMRAKTINSYMVYLLARTDDFRQSAINSMSGSDGRQRVKSDKLKMLDYLHPTSELVEKFENVEEPIFEKIYRLSKQMQQAKQARDLLLPKLMSGEVEV